MEKRLTLTTKCLLTALCLLPTNFVAKYKLKEQYNKMNRECKNDKRISSFFSKTKLFATLALFVSYNLGVNAQVTIGSGEAPNRVALLELKSQQMGADLVTSDKGGLLLPTVALVNSNTLQPFVPIDDPEWVNLTKQVALKQSAIGLMVYNVTTVGNSLYPGLYTWEGQRWATSQANPSAGIEIDTQPRAFTFYEKGTETPGALTFLLSGLEATDVVTYQWYQVTGNNVHIPVGAALTGEPNFTNGSQKATYTPSHILKGTTLISDNTGFYRFYCIAKNSYGKEFRSNVAEVAVGCGAKNNLGEWVSFMCFNLGAANTSSIASQKTYSIPYANDGTGLHTYQAGEEKLYGSLFQWGRVPDGHELRKSGNPNIQAYGEMKITDIASGMRCTNNGVSPTGINYPTNQIKEGTVWNGKFIMNSPAPAYNWNPTVAQSALDALWSVSGFLPNDPCMRYKTDGTYKPAWHNGTDGQADPNVCGPSGTAWRTPSQQEWGAIYRDGTLSGAPNLASANTWTWYDNGNGNRGYEIKPDGETTTLLLPASGFRHNGNGSFFNQAIYGIYLSTTTSASNAYSLYFSGGGVNPSIIYNRTYGFALRCVKQ